LKQRLRRGADRFEFSALIDGVSTLDDPITPAPEVEEPEGDEKSESEVQAPELLNERRVDQPVELPTTDDGGLPIADRALRIDSQPSPSDAQDLPSLASSSVLAAAREERLKIALDTLSGRLLREVGVMRAAMEAGDAEEAGFSLAHVNQILELLHTIDSNGDLARQMGITGAPPEGRAWPATAWSLVEFAESPFSALLPVGADEAFVHRVLYAAWGVAFESSD